MIDFENENAYKDWLDILPKKLVETSSLSRDRFFFMKTKNLEKEIMRKIVIFIKEDSIS